MNNNVPGVSSEGGGIIASKKSLSVGELRQAALGDPLDANMDLDAHSMDVNDHNGLGMSIIKIIIIISIIMNLYIFLLITLL